MRYKGYLIDLDGTIYLGEQPIPAGCNFVRQLQEYGIEYQFVTNNTTKTPEQVVEHLNRVCALSVEACHVYTATLATIDYMNQQKRGQKVFIIGESGLAEAIYAAGYQADEKAPDYVIVGLDRQVTYDKLAAATAFIRAGACFIGTNPDKNIPTAEGLQPGAGSLIALLEASTQIKPVIIGKPYPMAIKGALKRLAVAPEDVLLVGDNYETDIQAGIRYGLDTLLVLTGFTKKADVASLPDKPTFILNSLDQWEIQR